MSHRSLPVNAAIMAAASWLAAGCVPSPTAGVEDVPVPPQDGTAASHEQDGATADSLARQAQAARADLAARRGLDPDSIRIADAREVTWRSGALGCPRPGAYYTQALVPGFRIVLEVDGQAFSYHASAAGEPFLCPPDRIQSPAGRSAPSPE